MGNVAMIHGYAYKASNCCFVFSPAQPSTLSYLFCALLTFRMSPGVAFSSLCAGGVVARSLSPHSSHRDVPVKLFAKKHVGQSCVVGRRQRRGPDGHLRSRPCTELGGELQLLPGRTSAPGFPFRE